MTSQQSHQQILELIAKGETQNALSCLGDPESPLSSVQKMLLAASALQIEGREQESKQILHSLILQGDIRGKALAAEAIRFALKHDFKMAARCFRLACENDEIPDSYKTLVAACPSPESLGIDWLVKQFPQCTLDPKAVQTAAWLGCSGNEPALVKLHQPDHIFGPKEKGLTLDVEQLIETILIQKWENKDALPPPPVVEYYGVKRDIKGKRLLLCMEQMLLKFDNEQQSNEVFERLKTTAEEAGIEVHSLDITQLTVPNPNDANACSAAVARFEAAVAAFRPDYVIFSSPQTRHVPQLFIPSLFVGVKQHYGFKSLVFAGDTHECYPFAPMDWDVLVDLYLVASANGAFFDDEKIRKKTAPRAVFPFTEKQIQFSSMVEKDIGFFFCGRSTQSRGALCEAVAEATESKFIQYTNKPEGETFVSAEEFNNKLARSQITINCSHLGAIVTPRGRTIEAVANGVVLLDFGGFWPEQCYLPFIHYIPINNLDQATQFARFFFKRQDWRQRVANEALSFHRQHYNATAFWQSIAGQIEAG